MATATTTAKAAAALPATRSKITTTTWATALLILLKAPVTKNNVSNIQRWIASENSASSWLHTNNPLNTTYGRTGTGIPAYATVITGLIATADTINQGNGAFAGIAHALRTNAPTPVFKAAVVTSPWAAGHYGNGSNFASTPLVAYATGTGGNPEGFTGQAANALLSNLSVTQPVPSSTSQVDAVASSTAGVLSSAETVLKDLSSATFWKRVGVFVGGVVLVGGGIVLFVSISKTGQKVIQEGGGAAKVVA